MATATGEKTGGRKKGTPNKLTREVKQCIEQAFQNVGGVKYLERVAEDNPAVFCTLLGKILPKDVNVQWTLLEKIQQMDDEALNAELGRLLTEAGGLSAADGAATTH